MRIKEIGDMTITLTSMESLDIAFCIKHDIEHTAKTHWVNHFKGGTTEEFSNYVKSKESVKAEYLKFFLELTLRSDIIRDMEYNLKEVYANHLNEMKNKAS